MTRKVINLITLNFNQQYTNRSRKTTNKISIYKREKSHFNFAAMALTAGAQHAGFNNPVFNSRPDSLLFMLKVYDWTAYN